MFRRPPRATRTDLFPYTTLFRSDAAFAIWSAKVRYLGVGAMLVGGIWTLFSLRKSLLSGIRSGIAAARKGSGEKLAETERDLPMKWMLAALVVFVIPLALLYQAIVGQWSVSIPMKIGRAHVCTPVTNAHLVYRLLLEKT